MPILPSHSLGRKTRWEFWTIGFTGMTWLYRWHLYYAYRCPTPPENTTTNWHIHETHSRLNKEVKLDPEGEPFQFRVKFSQTALLWYRKQALGKHASRYSKSCLNVGSLALCVYPRTKTCMWNIFWPEKNYPNTKLPHPLFWTKWHMQCHQVQGQTHVTNSREFWLSGKHSWCIGEQFPAAGVPYSISNCVVCIHMPTQLQYRKQKFTAKISFSKNKSPL